MISTAFRGSESLKTLGVVFDWAGTLVDYGSLAPMVVFIDAFKDEDVLVTVDEIRAFMGLNKKEHVRSMLRLPKVADRWRKAHGKAPDETDVNRIYKKVKNQIVDVILTYSDPIPGAPETLETLRSLNIRIGACTGYSRSMMTPLAARLKKDGFITDCLVCASDVSRGRPAPFMCYQNAMSLDIYPMWTMVKVGDTAADIHEGLNAGMWTAACAQTGNALGLSMKETNQLPPAMILEKLTAVDNEFKREGAHYTV
jgi:phosphonoacetaldehyde hydrolase